MTRILGIDPGSRVTGYGVIDVIGARNRYQDSGCIRLPAGKPLAERLKTLFEGISQLIAAYHPEEMAVEQVFMHRNPDSALKLGQARGAVLCAGVLANLSISEYTPRAVKQAVVGGGGAAKEQVQHMVGVLLNLKTPLRPDAADALAIALCHGHTLQTQCRLRGATAEAARRR